MLRRWLLATLLSATGAGAARIDVDFDRTRRFHSFRTFAFVPVRDIRLRPPLDDALTRQRVEAAIARELQIRGLRPARPNEPVDLVVRCWTGVQERKESAAAAPHPWGPFNPFWRWRGHAYAVAALRVNEVRILVDLIERSARELAWRASIRDAAPKPAEAGKKIDEWMEKAFARYPISFK